MNRRQVINRLTLISGSVLLASSGLLQACHLPTGQRTVLTQADIPLLDEIGETIIPATASSPGAKATKIGAYMLIMVNECYTQQQKDAFIVGLDKFEKACMDQFNSGFIHLTAGQKTEFLTGIEKQSRYLKSNPDTRKNNIFSFFDSVKQLSISGYFTSEIGATKARRYEAIPGSFHGRILYKKGDRAWATG